MIDLEHEELLTMGQAARLIPSRNGKKAHPMTLWRWCTKGHRGVKLESVRTPDGVYLTTAVCVLRFLQAMADLDAGRIPLESSRERDMRQAIANAKLDAWGIK